MTVGYTTWVLARSGRGVLSGNATSLGLIFNFNACSEPSEFLFVFVERVDRI